MTVGVLVGNPKPQSRTLAAATRVASELNGADADVIVDVVELGAGLLSWDDAGVAEAVAAVRSVDLLVVASPTYKASFTGLLKLFLDQLPGGALDGIIAVPLMLGAGPGHALAAGVHLAPVLTELGATVATKPLFLIDSNWQGSDTLADWLPPARALLTRLGVVHGAASTADAGALSGAV
jgi:FMN reductase